MPAEEALQPEMAAVLNAERLEVSVDGLTLSPDPEERPGAEGAPLLPSPLPSPSSPGSGRGSGTAGEQPVPGEAEEEARRLEQLWGFGLEELYGLALRFFKGEGRRARRLGVARGIAPCRPGLGRGDPTGLSLSPVRYGRSHWVHAEGPGSVFSSARPASFDGATGSHEAVDPEEAVPGLLFLPRRFCSCVPRVTTSDPAVFFLV